MSITLLDQFGLNVPDPDTELLALIDQYTSLRDAAWECIRKAAGYSEKSRRNKELWNQALSTHTEREALEQRICRMQAKTQAGLIAKLRLGIEQIDPDGDGHIATIFSLPFSALADTLAFATAGRMQAGEQAA